jgi:hypothetical protein
MAGFGNIGGIIATYSFVQSDAPFYRKGYAICVSFICLSAVSCIAYALSVVWENGKRAKQPHNLNLTESEKIELGVSVPFNFIFCFSVGFTDGMVTNGLNLGSEPGVPVHALRAGQKVMAYDVMMRRL